MEAKAAYALFTVAHCCRFCWYCGRWEWDRPKDWGGPFLIERAHVVSKPRREDVRAVILLCTLCHKVEHGERFAFEVLPACTLQNALWLKRRFDGANYDRAFLAKNAVGRLPHAKKPGVVVQREFLTRQGRYP